MSVLHLINLMLLFHMCGDGSIAIHPFVEYIDRMNENNYTFKCVTDLKRLVNGKCDIHYNDIVYCNRNMKKSERIFSVFNDSKKVVNKLRVCGINKDYVFSLYESNKDSVFLVDYILPANSRGLGAAEGAFEYLQLVPSITVGGITLPLNILLKSEKYELSIDKKSDQHVVIFCKCKNKSDVYNDVMLEYLELLFQIDSKILPYKLVNVKYKTIRNDKTYSLHDNIYYKIDNRDAYSRIKNAVSHYNNDGKLRTKVETDIVMNYDFSYSPDNNDFSIVKYGMREPAFAIKSGQISFSWFLYLTLLGITFLVISILLSVIKRRG